MVTKSNTVFIWFTIITFSVTLCTGQDLNIGHKYRPNLDFLQHESGTTPPKPDYASLFPPLPSKNIPGSSSSTLVNGNVQPSGKRDYVASDFPALKPPANRNNGHTTSPTASTTSINSQQSGGKRDYVAPNFPSLKPISNQNKGHTTSPVSNSATNKNTQQTNARRDYVAPQYTTPTSPSASNGKVKDLINFFGGQGPNNKPSYSSVISGGQNTPSTVRTTQPIPTYSTAGLDKHGTTILSSPWTNGHSTAKPTTRLPHEPATNTRNPAVQRPGSTFMPSSFINNNKKDQGSGNGPSDTEIEALSEELLRKDSNNAAKFITVNVQEKSTFQSKDDKAPQPLFVVSDKVWNMPTIQKFVPLLDNYERDTTVNEYVTPQERNEENAFLDAIMSTSVIRHLMNFFKEKGYVTPDPKQQRDFLKQLWFNLYARSRGKLSSSGFEHIFVSELKNGDVSGLHNWIYFSREESANRINYLGYLKYLQLNDKGAILKLHFNQQGADKPTDTMFIGTSPELEVALYTLCFVTRADKDCKLKLAGKDVNIVTHTFRYRSKNLIGSAYPQI